MTTTTCGSWTRLLPYIAKTHKLNLSTDGNDRAIAGTSSGGSARFTRPGAARRLRRVFSNVGSFARTAAATSTQPRPQVRAQAHPLFLQDAPTT